MRACLSRGFMPLRWPSGLTYTRPRRMPGSSGEETLGAREARKPADGERGPVQLQAPPLLASLVRQRRQGAEPGEVDEVDAGQVDDDVAAARTRAAHLLAQHRRGSEVQLPAQVQPHGA